MGNDKIIGFVPARGGSKSIPLKNIKPFCGQPLIYWTLKALQDTPAIDLIYFATDSDEIESCAQAFNFSKLKIYRREASNAEDRSSTESVMLEFIEKGEFNGKELFMLVQATSPFVQQTDIAQAIEQYKNSGCDSLLSCSRTKRFFWTEKGVPINYDFKSRPRRQDFDGMMMENGAFYLNTIANIKKDRNRLSGTIGIYEMEEFAGYELDEPHDWMIGEALMRHYILKNAASDRKAIKLVLTDVDGVLTDAGMYYSESGDELKKFNTLDGKAFELLRNQGIKTGIITAEDTRIVERRAKKIKSDFLFQGAHDKLSVAKEICKQLNITLREVAYVGDDINDLELLGAVGIAACPAHAVDQIKSINGIVKLKSRGGEGAFRELVNLLTSNESGR